MSEMPLSAKKVSNLQFVKKLPPGRCSKHWDVHNFSSANLYASYAADHLLRRALSGRNLYSQQAGFAVWEVAQLSEKRIRWPILAHRSQKQAWRADW